MTEDDEFEIEIDRAGSDDTEERDDRDERDDRAESGDRVDRAPSNPAPAPVDTGRIDPHAEPSVQDLEDELGRIGVSTTPEGYVEGRVVGLESLDETTVRLEVSLPHDEVVEFRLEKPIPWSEEFLLARIVQDVGYDAASISHLVGERVYLTRADVEPDAPPSSTDRRWLRSPAKLAGDTLLATLGSRYRLEERRRPEWRLVDPQERRAEEDELGRPFADPATLGLALLALAPIVAGFAVAYALTGGLAVSGGVVGSVLLGLLLAWFGAAAVLRSGD